MRTPNILIAARVEALYASDLSTGAAADRRVADAAIRSAVRRHGGVRGCLAVLATEYGEHPELAATRSAWARRLVEDIYHRESRPPAQRSGISVPSARDIAPATLFSTSPDTISR